MTPTRSDGGTARLAPLNPYRWWIVTVVSLVAVVALLVLDVDVLIQVLVVGVGLMLWGPVLVGWARGLWKSGRAFREGLDGR